MSLIRLTEQGRPPPDAIPISRDEAIINQWRLVYEWRPMTDLWAVRMSTYATTGINTLTGLYINNFYRKKLKLAGYGFTASFLPLVLMPAMFGGIFHRQFITSKILLMEENCPVCTQIKAVGFQLVTGVVYPLILGPMTNYMLASRYDIARIPIIHTETKKLWAFHMKTSRPLYGVMSYFALANVLLTSLMTYYEFVNVINMNEKMEEAALWHSTQHKKVKET